MKGTGSKHLAEGISKKSVESLASFGLLIAKHKKREEEGIVKQKEVELGGFNIFPA